MMTLTVSRRLARDQKIFSGLLVALIAQAWLTLWLWGRSPYARYLSLHALEEVRGDALLMLVFVAGWIVMIVAMMLPTSLPVVNLFRALIRQRPDANRLGALLIAGYLGVWTSFGLLVYLGDWLIHLTVERSVWLETNVRVVGMATLALAGLYQFSPLKYHCLDKCRSPLSFVIEHWRGHRESAQSFVLGAHHGLFCVGCCWSLMLLMFAVGAGSLGWMLVLGAIMAAEKDLPWGRRLSVPLGGALLAWAVVLLLLNVANPGAVHPEPHAH